jgi:hypothetical protein
MNQGLTVGKLVIFYANNLMEFFCVCFEQQANILKDPPL